VPDGHDTVLAVVHDPGPPETLTAMRGAGAALNGSVLRASDCAPARRGNRRAQLPPYPRRKLHLVCDNYATHKDPTVNAWLARNPRIILLGGNPLAETPAGRPGSTSPVTGLAACTAPGPVCVAGLGIRPVCLWCSL